MMIDHLSSSQDRSGYGSSPRRPRRGCHHRHLTEGGSGQARTIDMQVFTCLSLVDGRCLQSIGGPDATDDPR